MGNFVEQVAGVAEKVGLGVAGDECVGQEGVGREAESLQDQAVKLLEVRSVLGLGPEL